MYDRIIYKTDMYCLYRSCAMRSTSFRWREIEKRRLLGASIVKSVEVPTWPGLDPPPRLSATGVESPLVKRHHPLVDNPLGAGQDGAAAVHRELVPAPVRPHSPPEPRRAAGRPHCHLVRPLEEGCLPASRGVPQPAHHRPHDVPGVLQVSPFL